MKNQRILDGLSEIFSLSLYNTIGSSLTFICKVQ